MLIGLNCVRDAEEGGKLMRGCKRPWMNRICQVHDIKGRCAQVRAAREVGAASLSPSWNSAEFKCDYVESTM